jgi:hypothetical protein
MGESEERRGRGFNSPRPSTNPSEAGVGSRSSNTLSALAQRTFAISGRNDLAVGIGLVNNCWMATPDRTKNDKDDAERSSVPDGGLNDGAAAMAMLVLAVALIVFVIVML